MLAMRTTSALLATLSLEVVISGADCRCEGNPVDKGLGGIGIRSDLGVAICHGEFGVN